MFPLQTTEQKINLLLRAGVAFAFIYPAVSAIFNPFAWIGYFPAFLLNLPIQGEILLHVFGAIEIILGLWILSNRNIFIPSIVAAVMLFSIVIFNLNQMDVVFRDISILAMAVALALQSRAHTMIE
jgi:hypothetical protein